MKKSQVLNKSIFIVATVLCILLFNQFSYAGEKTAEISLPTIQCGSCVRTIEKALDKVEGIKNIDIDVENKKATITYDDSKTDLSKIEDGISGAGYDANNKKANQTAYSNLHTCCKLPKDR
jgi:copper chaperone CopZ